MARLLNLMLVLGLVYAFAPSEARLQGLQVTQDLNTTPASVTLAAAPEAQLEASKNSVQNQKLAVSAADLAKPFLNIAFERPEPGSLQAELAGWAAAACDRYCAALSGRASQPEDNAASAAAL